MVTNVSNSTLTICEREKLGMIRNCGLCSGYNQQLYCVCEIRYSGSA